MATPSARIKSVRMTFSVFEDDDARELTDTEWSRVVVRAPCVCMRSADTDDVVVDHDAPNGSAFTVRDLAAVIAKTEHESRERGSWMGGVDVRHVYFEGIELEDGHDEPS